MYVYAANINPRLGNALADFDLLRSTCEVHLRAPVPHPAAINEAFDAAHNRLRAAHLRWQNNCRPVLSSDLG